MDLDILYEDGALLVVYKPAQVAVETKKIGQQDMVSLLRNRRAVKGEEPYIGLVHRLDQPVEGVMVFGKTKEATADLSGQVRERIFGKNYYAIGRFDGTAPLKEQGRLEDAILFDRKNNVSRIVEKNTKGSQQAVLDYSIIGQEAEETCFDITLHTGRHHQIRVQLSHAGYPLIGDRKYGYGTQNESSSLALCSYRLQFFHPLTKKRMDFTIHPHNPLFCRFFPAKPE